MHASKPLEGIATQFFTLLAEGYITPKQMHALSVQGSWLEANSVCFSAVGVWSGGKVM